MIKYIRITVLVILCGLIAFGFIMVKKNQSLSEEFEIAVANNKAYEAQLTQERQAFQFTVDQLQYLNDSTVRELDSVRRELKIKDNKIKQMSKLKEYVYIHDSLVIHDTIFQEGFALDTCISDEWHSTCLDMSYPGYINCSNSVNLDNDCFLYVTRETVNPPCKTWIGRLFQKKHDVYNVTVIENNPYVTVKESKFIIIKD